MVVYAVISLGVVKEIVRQEEPPERAGYEVVVVPEDKMASIGWIWDGNTIAKEDGSEVTLEVAKQVRHQEIDARTEQLLSPGFMFREKNMSLSTDALAYLSCLHQLRDDIVYPFLLDTIDNDTLTMEIPDDVHKLLMDAITAMRGHKDTGTSLKAQIRLCESIAAVTAIVDTR